MDYDKFIDGTSKAKTKKKHWKKRVRTPKPKEVLKAEYDEARKRLMDGPNGQEGE